MAEAPRCGLMQGMPLVCLKVSEAIIIGGLLCCVIEGGTHILRPFKQYCPERSSLCHREDAEAVMKLYRRMVVDYPEEAATHEEMVMMYLFLWSLQSEENEMMESEALAFMSGENGIPSQNA